MRFFKLCIILFALSVSTQAMAAANLDKEQAGCVGAHSAVVDNMDVYHSTRPLGHIYCSS